MCSFRVVGISDEARPVFSDEVNGIIASAHYFSGAARHYDLVKHLLPANHQWMEVVVPLQLTFEQYRALNEEIVVFASGDPLFFGIANTLKRDFPDASLKVYPTFNSLQMLAHHCHLPYGLMKVATLTGRPWPNLDKELVQGSDFIGVLTDKNKTPAAIGQRMKEAGLLNYKVYLGERMGGELQVVRELSVDELASVESIMPNCLILEKTVHFERTFGIPEEGFHHLEGRPKMITKRSIRLMTLSMLKLDTAKVLWDIGFCTGSVSIEAKQMAPQMEVFSIEKRKESRALIQKNQQKFRIPGIKYCIDDFYTFDLSKWKVPDRIFIGGHGGRLKEMVARLETYLQPGGIMVFNAVSDETATAFKEAIEAVSMTISDKMPIQQDDHNPVTLYQAIKNNS
ncbi:precorrin-6y C5,15-methyltransferase (decarboxylating) subunit CbiE [Carboxylicivirga sediminis]|uniref:Precorrin-6y C5,15-methyltransferase (Decarboxylating) subunit CbiE n=1 Tax=Carboxylicivirga sediminis TaxID=2006564 RepID=A0A941F2K2_9BACT|nr:precorrin-6y C5,15-methyltransferase (decarboxylating) subunit CbiE [Carboxylicivirga sediminis]MBR8535134.1 precorrin-6y C5,15-methyltransferase (decarboxylating) subunit CbiE [Carboxylicivirga sediminis]